MPGGGDNTAPNDRGQADKGRPVVVDKVEVADELVGGPRVEALSVHRQLVEAGFLLGTDFRSSQ